MKVRAGLIGSPEVKMLVQAVAAVGLVLSLSGPPDYTQALRSLPRTRCR
jgi:hypothetical protein